MALKKTLVPDLAIIPRLFTSLFFVRTLHRDGRIGHVRNDHDEETGLGLDLLWIRGVGPDLVESIGGIRNQLAEKDFLVGIGGVDDQAHQLLIGEGLQTWFRENPGTMVRYSDDRTCAKKNGCEEYFLGKGQKKSRVASIETHGQRDIPQNRMQKAKMTKGNSDAHWRNDKHQTEKKSNMHDNRTLK